jgi:micrococcal nuclease
MKRILLIAAIILLGLFTKEARMPKPELSDGGQATSSASLTATSSARVVRVIDGDTIEIETGQKVRYIGIDTPETTDTRRPVMCFGKEAKLENEKMVNGKTVRLEKDISETDKYGRLLRYVYINDVFVNDYLVRQGFAHASTFPPDVTFAKQFVAAQEEARVGGKGLWSGCPSG